MTEDDRATEPIIQVTESGPYLVHDPSRYGRPMAPC